MMSHSYKCHECSATTPKIGMVEVEAGWGKFQGRIGMGRTKRSITLIHCPLHIKGFYVVVEQTVRKLSKEVRAV